VESTLISSDKDEDAFARERVKAYTKAHIQHLQSNLFGHMFGVGPRQLYLKLEKKPDANGGRKRTESACSQPVNNSVLVNVITH
jgi:hypothetical protein